MPQGLDYIINLKDGDFGGAEKAKSEIEGVDTAVAETHEGLGGLKGMLGEVAIAMGEAFAVEKVIDFGKESLSVYRSTAQAEGQIAAGIKSTAGAAGLSLDELKEKAEELEHRTLFTQAQTEGAQAIALSFTNIKGAIFNEAIPAIQDLATRMGGDLNNAATQLGKALQDPIQGVTALQRVGVKLSDAQKEMIASDVKHGEVQKAQSIILKELQTEFGGSAQAARSVLGPAGDLNEKIEDLKKGFGHFIDDGLRVAIPLLFDVGNWFNDNKGIIGDVAIVVGAGAVAWAAYEGVLLGVNTVSAITNGLMVAYNGIAAISLYYDVARAEGMGVLTAAQWALNVAMEANPIGLIITGVGVLIGLVYEAYKHSETFRAVLAGIGDVAESIVPIFKGLGEVIWGALSFDPELIKKGFEDSVHGVQNIIANGGISGVFMKGAIHSLTESQKEDADQKKKDDDAKKHPESASGLVPHGKPAQFSIATGGRGGKTAGSGSETLSGGRSVRNVVVTIGKLVERIEVHTTNLQGVSKEDLKRQLTEILTGAVHDSELALGSQ